MNVADLIKALQALPQHLPVTAFVPVIDVVDDGMIHHEMSEADAAEVTDVRFAGRSVVLEAGGMIR
ncbi:MAG: hypothetical protein ING73_11260 [Rhodocyclaceae bacterium]|nr:hypothetical protein [Rhodocyclaceae bacterium]